MAERITVKQPDETNRAYDILIESGLLQHLDSRAAEFGLENHVVVITNTTVRHLYGNALVERLPNAHLAVMNDGEQYKNLDTVHSLYDQCFAAKADRHSTIIALGGGVVGDTAGFVAATYMRGIRLVQIPTSLLAMVDSSVGGKVGVDVPQGKNLVGAFKNPETVLIDPVVLQTLPPEQWRCGMGEVIKHGFIADESLLDSALHHVERSAELVRRAVQVKVDVVQQDPYEKGIRAYLNLGHTFGHALEQVTQYKWMHGDGVGFGLLAAAKLSHKLGMIDESLVQRVEKIVQDMGFPQSIGDLDPVAIWDAMSTDKKWKSGKSRFVLAKQHVSAYNCRRRRT
ncbi:MAG: 3-dehydroquinate synthase [Anaerolineae bacterium]|nr:3-dehydroquinate synthase [Anaerolineae bacterium]